MHPEELIGSIYLGDRACKGIQLDSWEKRVAIHVDVISRTRPGKNEWDFYTDEDLPDGRLVFTGVQNVRFEPSGPLPNDYINDLSVSPTGSSAGPGFRFVVSISSVDETGRSTEILVHIEAAGLQLEAPNRPGVDLSERTTTQSTPNASSFQ